MCSKIVELSLSHFFLVLSNKATILDKSPWDSTAIFLFFCYFSVPSQNSASFSKFSCSSPSPYPIQSWNSEIILDTHVQHCLWGEGRGWTGVNWKTPQKRKCLKTFVHDCSYYLCNSKIHNIIIKSDYRLCIERHFNRPCLVFYPF